MTRFVDLHGHRTAYDVRGEGAPILLVHGAEATRESFSALAEALAAHACVVTYDQRGCGESAADAGEHHIPDLAQDANDLMESLGFARFAVMGTSLGGRIAQSAALGQPARLTALVLCNTWPLDRAIADLHPEGARKLRTLRAGLPSSARALAEMFYTPAHVATHPQLADRFARAPSTSRRGLLAAETHPLLRAESISVTTLCLSGSEDRVVPSRVAKGLSARIPNSRFEPLPGVGHSAAVQAPALLADQIASFLDRSIHHL
ncbi:MULTISPECIES: alpha/beta fold hydrolase [Ramlibacter]|nr:MULTISPECIES: alpha/beta hydrolase [Ramlibacter]MBA2962160.1 alpha/beta fold hydrolase [Ramlibacter sp. CGMCC 1.13660]